MSRCAAVTEPVVPGGGTFQCSLEAGHDGCHVVKCGDHGAAAAPDPGVTATLRQDDPFFMTQHQKRVELERLIPVETAARAFLTAHDEYSVLSGGPARAAAFEKMNDAGEVLRAALVRP